MEKQTVMQELLEFCEYRQIKAADGSKSAWNMILAKIKDDGLIEMEKEQIVNSFEIGYENGACVNDGESVYHGTNYYNKTFKNK
jgi:hypothetical protein